MRVHKMTPWDEGQVMIKASDTLLDCAEELRPTQPEWAEKLRLMALEIGSIFNKHGSHSFGLRSKESP